MGGRDEAGTSNNAAGQREELTWRGTSMVAPPENPFLKPFDAVPRRAQSLQLEPVDKNFKRYFATTAARRCVSRVSSLSPN
jgi:hypothetical protein